ncbi:MAG: hypothetical protein AB7N76_21480 [Planctomycetota bacterium]
MTPFELGEALRGQNAEGRAGVLRALTDEQVVQLDATLLAVALVESSGVVRGVVSERLAARPAAARARRALPEGHIDLAGQEALTQRWAALPGFAEGLLAYDRGRELLGRVSCAGEVLEERLLELAREAPPDLLAALLRLPLDLGGRLASLLPYVPALAPRARETLAHALADAALSDAGVVIDAQRERGRAALALWLEGLVATIEEPELEAPELAAFVAGGAGFGQGVVTQTLAAPPDARTLAGLAPLARCIYLALGPPARRTLLERGPLALDVRSPHPDLRVVAWKLLLKHGLAEPSEVLDAALGPADAPAQEPGLTVELLAALPPGGLGREQVLRLLGLLQHPRAAVRAAASALLARDPLAAALAASSIDPRAPEAPLAVLAAQPPALASASLTAYLEVERPDELAAAAFARLAFPPSPGWERWARWLTGPGLADEEGARAASRRAAREALLRLPPGEAPELPELLERVGDDGLLVACAWRFELPTPHAPLERLLLSPELEDEQARRAIELLSRTGDLRAWLLLWRFVVGEGRRRFGTRVTRLLALEALRAMRPPSEERAFSERDPEGWIRAAWPRWAGSGAIAPRRLPERALPLLLRDRDPEQVALALSWIDHQPPARELLYEVEDLTWRALALVQRGAGARRLALGWRRCLRRLLPRRWVRPNGPGQRGRAGRARLLARLLEDLLRRGSRALQPDVVEPRHDHPRPELAAAAARLLVALLQTPLQRLVELARPAVVEEAVRVGHPAQVEALIARKLTRALTVGRSDELGPHLTAALRWLELRPATVHLPQLEALLGRARGARRAALLAALGALQRVEGGRAAVCALLRRELEAASEQRAEGRLRAALDAVERLRAWELVGGALPALAWAGDATRRRLRELLRAATDHGQRLEPRALEPLLQHPLVEVRTLAISLLRRSGAGGLWELVRPYGPGVRQRPTELSKRLLGICEDAFEASMVLTLEALLEHQNGEVARRALKLLNRREQELAAPTLLQRLDDPELRAPVLTTFSTWARRFLPAGLAPELLEDQRRQLRARLTQLAEGQRAQVLALLDETRAAAIPYERVAALLAVGRLVLEEERAWVAGCLAEQDPMLQRAAALAAGALAPGDDLDAPLRALAQAREPEVRAAARAALIARLDLSHLAEVDALLVDRAPEVTLAALAALRARPALLAEVTLTPLLGERDARVREAVLRALSERPAPEDELGVGALAGALRDPVPDVRLEALAVVRAWEAVEPLAFAVGERLSDPSVHVSGAALELLGEHLGADLGGGAGGALKVAASVPAADVDEDALEDSGIGDAEAEAREAAEAVARGGAAEEVDREE